MKGEVRELKRPENYCHVEMSLEDASVIEEILQTRLTMGQGSNLFSKSHCRVLKRVLDTLKIARENSGITSDGHHVGE